MIGQYLDSIEGSAANKERWLLSYADLLMLLLAFFVVMYSVSVVNEQKLANLSASIDKVLDPEKPVAPLASVAIEITDIELPNIKINTGSHDWIEFVLDSEVLFASGKAEILLGSHVALEHMLTILMNAQGEIFVEGHTDNDPIGNVFFPSNWELSSARAAAVVRFLESRGILSTRLVAMGFGETKPIADNNTPLGRAQNRRVVFRIKESNLDMVFLEQLSGSGRPVLTDASLTAQEILNQALIDQTSSFEFDPTRTVVEPDAVVDGSEFELDNIDPALLEQILKDLENQ